MADTARGKVYMTPIVTIAADDDADSVDAIHHDVKKSIGGKLETNFTDHISATGRWYYSAATDVSTSHANLIGGFSSSTDYTDGTAIATADDVRFVSITHTGFQGDGSTVSTDKLYITLDGGDASTQTDAIMLESGESINLKFKDASGCDIDALHAASSANTIETRVLAMCDDGA
jgi:hypothetical protein